MKQKGRAREIVDKFRRKHIAKMRVNLIVRQLRPRSKSSISNYFLILSIVGLLWYTLHWKRTANEVARSRHSLGHYIVNKNLEDNSNVQQLANEENMSNDVHEMRYQKESGKPDDDPFNRGILKRDKKKVKLAEESPIESEGRKMHAKLEVPAERAVGNEPIILVWKAMEYQMKHYKEHLEYISPPECGGCKVTTNRKLVRECAALVHFNSPDLRKFLDVPDPKTRNPNQLYAFWSRETPAKTYHFGDVLKDPRFDSIFNLTINFRPDSDIVDYFGNIQYELTVFQEKQKSDWFEKMMTRKSGLAIWAVSNCNNTHGAAERMKYAMRLIKSGLKMTTYGTCFNNRFKGSDLVKEMQRHKFYISFENSIHCPDYVSEKFWRNGLRSSAVPIVWGPTKEDVIKVAPVNSFIHAEDFKSPEELVDYVNYLDRNDTAYRQYHQWRFQPLDKSIPYEDIIPTHRSTLCRLCKKVTDKHLIRKTVPSVYNWLYKTGFVDDKCLKS